MDKLEFAMDLAKEITVAALQNPNAELTISKLGGQEVYDFYDTILKNLYKLANEMPFD